jgi:hypothetical protein
MKLVIESPNGWHRAELETDERGVTVTITEKLARGDAPLRIIRREVFDAPLHLVRDRVHDAMQRLDPPAAKAWPARTTVLSINGAAK